MGDFTKLGGKWEASQYVTVAAGQTTAAVGGLRSYLESVTITPASSGAGAVTIYDGSTAIMTIPAIAGTGTGTQVQVPYRVGLGIRATSPTTGFKVTTGASVAVICVGRFSS
jgi:hypothetical protein